VKILTFRSCLLSLSIPAIFVKIPKRIPWNIEMRSHDGNNTQEHLGYRPRFSLMHGTRGYPHLPREAHSSSHQQISQRKQTPKLRGNEEKLNISQDPPGLTGTSPAKPKFGAVIGPRSEAKKFNSPPKILRSWDQGQDAGSFGT
jgi:hypothetical protein